MLKWKLGELSTTSVQLGAVAATFLLAAATYHLIENRVRRWRPRRLRLIFAALAVSVASLELWLALPQLEARAAEPSSPANTAITMSQAIQSAYAQSSPAGSSRPWQPPPPPQLARQPAASNSESVAAVLNTSLSRQASPPPGPAQLLAVGSSGPAPPPTLPLCSCFNPTTGPNQYADAEGNLDYSRRLLDLLLTRSVSTFGQFDSGAS